MSLSKFTGPLTNILNERMNRASSLNHSTISVAVTASYFVFYTAYDKQKKTLLFKNLTDLVTCNRGVDWTLVEINKAISLSAITTMLISFLPNFSKQSEGLLCTSMVMLWSHSVYSMYKFYGFESAKVLKDKTIKQISIALGVGGQIAISAGYMKYISNEALVIGATLFGIGHFWTMEVDYKYKLQVRPYAYFPFVLAIPALMSVFSTSQPIKFASW